MATKYTRTERLCIAGIFVCTALFLAFLLLSPRVADQFDPDNFELLDMALSRFLAGLIFLFLILYLGYPLLSFRRVTPKALLLSLPALVIAVNNFPILGLIGGTVWVEKGLDTTLLLIATCLGIGFFEEIAFRGVIFPALLKKMLKITEKKHPFGGRIAPETVAVFLSIVATSAVFGLIHALNLFVGESPVAVLMQVGYSFLIGGMCAIVLLKTRCIWFPIILHAVYDFGGMMIRYLGDGKLWDTPTVVLTVIVSVAVAAYFLVLLFRTKPDEIRALLKAPANS